MNKLHRFLEESVHNYQDITSFRFVTEDGLLSVKNDILFDRAKEIANFLPQSRLIILGENSLAWMTVYLAGLYAGAVIVPLDTELLPVKTSELIKKIDPALIFVSPGQKEKLKDLTTSIPIIELQEQEKILSALESLELARLPDSEYSDNIATIVNSSGTGGKLKGILLGHEQIIDVINFYKDSFSRNDIRTILCVLPCFAIYPAVFCFAALASGNTVYFADPKKVDLLKVLQSYPVDCLPLVPLGITKIHDKVMQTLSQKGFVTKLFFKLLTETSIFLRRYLNLNAGTSLFSSIHKAFGSDLKIILTGGASLNPTITKDFFGWGYTIIEGYGLTETAGVVSLTNGDYDSIGTCGKPVQGFTITIHSPDKDGCGEILIRGHRIMSGYFREEEANQQCWLDGSFRTGDLGKFDHRGNLIILGRIKDIIVSSDERKTLPQDIEEQYEKIEGIEKLAVVGIEDPVTKADRVYAAVVPEKRVIDMYKGDSKEIKKHLENLVQQKASELPPYLQIEHVILLDHLPTNSLGKVKRAELKSKFSAPRDSH